MHQELARALKTEWLQERFGISRTTIQTWRADGIPAGSAKGRLVLDAVATLLRETEEAPPPQWATGLADDVVDRVTRLLAEQLPAMERMIASLEAQPLPHDEASPGPPGAQGRGARGPLGQ